MIKVFGYDIKGAYTGGTPVKEIYSYGVKVWPEEDAPVLYDYLQGRATPVNSDTPVPRIRLTIPYVNGGMNIRARINSDYTTKIKNGYVVYNVYGKYDDEQIIINWAHISRQSNYYIMDAFCRSNTSPKQIQPYSDYGLRITVPDDSYDSELYVNGTKYVDPNPYPKSHNYYPSSLIITLFSGPDRTDPYLTGSPHKLYRFWIEDNDGNTLYDFVPAVIDGEAGLYEKKHKTFHTKDLASASDFTVGNLT